MSGIAILLDRLNSQKFMYWVFGIVLFAHLVLFIKYPPSFEMSFFTRLGENLKDIFPTALLVTLLPAIHKRMDKVITRKRINIISMAVIFLCLVYQLVGVSGQAWSTVAFSGLLILILFNNLSDRYNMSTTIAAIFSFMVVWVGWVGFEIIFKVGQYLYHPMVFGLTEDVQYRNFIGGIMMMGKWMFPAVLFIAYVVSESKKAIKIKLGNYRYFLPVAAVCIAATSIWLITGFLIPIPVDEKGLPYILELNYWTNEHLQFSISRLSQITMMTALPILFLRKGG
jgi:hypothetical protein